MTGSSPGFISLAVALGIHREVFSSGDALVTKSSAQILWGNTHHKNLSGLRAQPLVFITKPLHGFQIKTLSLGCDLWVHLGAGKRRE